jgi:hypothetical protein
MAKSATTVSDEVFRRARVLAGYVNRIERLGASDRDLSRVYAGAYMDFVTFLERSVERLFLGLLMQRFHHPSANVLVTVKSEAVARRLVRGERSYVDWFPYQNTVKRAQAFLSSGLPFAATPKADQRAIWHATLLRNALAHQSRHSLAQFQEQLVVGRSLPPSHRTPAQYLRGQHSASQSRLVFHMAETSAAIQRLCS